MDIFKQMGKTIRLVSSGDNEYGLERGDPWGC